MESVATPLKPLAVGKALLIFLGTSAAIYLGLYGLIPILQRQGQTFLSSYLFSFYPTFAVMFLLALFLYWQEGNVFTWAAFKARYRLQPIKGKSWLAVVALLVTLMAAMGIIYWKRNLLSLLPVTMARRKER
jgi:hypothetical protein